MRVLFLGSKTSLIYLHLKDFKEELIQTEDLLTVEKVKEWKADFLVSHGYRHIIRKNVLDLFPHKAINLHISYLPWNRGADPNFWSLVENTPKGVSIHYIDEGVDTGDIIAQEKVDFEPHYTLKSSYDHLQNSMANLFKKEWPQIKSGKCSRIPQKGEGSIHKMKDKERLSFLTAELGYETPIRNLEQHGRKNEF